MPHDINYLTLTYGNVITSPEEVTALNQNPASAFFDETLSVEPSKSGYQVLLSGYAQYVRSQEAKTNEYRSLLNSLRALKSTPRPADAFKLKGSASTHRSEGSDYVIDYRVHSGQVMVFNIQPADKLQKLRDSQEKTELYKVSKEASGRWNISGKITDDKVKTKHAAVNGQSNNLSKATWLMGKHLEVEYGEGVTEYTLFHNSSVGGAGDTWESIQDKFGFTTDVTKRFSQVLEKTQQRDSDTYWVAHSQGGLIFSEGIRYLLNDKSSSLLNKLSFNGIRHSSKGELLNKQKVAFHGNANNDFRSKHLLERAGVDVVSIRQHDYDFVTNLIGMNAKSVRKVVGSIVYSSHVFNGSIAQSPHTLSQSHKQWDENMKNGPGKGRNAIQTFFEEPKKGLVKAKNWAVDVVKNYLP